MSSMDEPMTRITWTTRRHYEAEIPTRLWHEEGHAPDQLLASIEIHEGQADPMLDEVMDRQIESADHGY